MKSENLACAETDKTGKLTLDTLENISSKMDKHIREDKIVDTKEVKKIENKLNRHMAFWTKILKPGENNNHIRRIKSNLITKDNQIPILRGTNKDHKEVADKVAGPDVRPIMGAMVGPNLGLSELGSLIVRKIADNADTGLVAKSTEEVISKFEEFNKNRFEKTPGLRKLIIASMDIEKFYPNILSEESAAIIRNMWEESDISMEGVDIDNLSNYLGKVLKKLEIAEEGFAEIVYTKKPNERKKTVSKKTSRKHQKKKIKQNIRIQKDRQNKDISCSEGADTQETTSEILDINNSGGEDTPCTIVKKKTKTKTKTEWLKPRRKPTELEGRKMFGKALEMMLRLCMENHLYQFENKVRIQKKGGPIGLKLTGEIADCIMLDWDKKLLEKLKKLKMIPDVYTRFKDDIEIAIESLDKGSKLTEDGRIIVDERKKEKDEERSDSKVTMDVVQQIANSVNPMIKLTVETPCNFKDGKLPVLDIKVNINQNEMNRIDFEHYEKPTKNPRVILANSALSFKKKRTILTQEGLRRLRNTKRELGPEVQTKYLNLFMLSLMKSGYSQKFRQEILDSVLKAYQKMVEDDTTGVKPMYRNREWNKEERIKVKSTKKSNWWNTVKSDIQYKTVLFVTPTPGGQLMKELQKRESELNKNNEDRIKIVEKGGLKIKNVLCAKNPFRKSKCQLKTCPLCADSKFVEGSSDEVKIACNTNNVGYKWQCLTCREDDTVKVYEGETGRSARLRGAEHLKQLEKKSEKSVLFKHKMTTHKNEEVKFKMEITGQFKDALSRQANEAVRISSRPTHELLNSKSEFNHPPTARVIVEKKKLFQP